MKDQDKTTRDNTSENNVTWEQTDSQRDNEKMFGALVGALATLKLPGHIYSFIIGEVVSVSILMGFGQRFGIPVNIFTITAAIILGCIFGLALEYLHHEVPRPGWRIIFDICAGKKQPKGRIVMLVIILAAGYGLTRFSGVLTSMGGEMSARSIYTEPPVPDLSGRAGQYISDTVATARGYDGHVQAINTKYDGLVDSVRSKHQPIIDKRNREAAGYEKLNSQKHTWAPGSAKKARRLASNQASYMQAGIDDVNADRAADLSPIVAERSNKLLSIAGQYHAERDTAMAKHWREVDRLKKENDELASLGNDIGGYVVWFLFLLSFFIELYDYSRGKPYEGFAFNPARRFTRFWENVKGIFTDKADHTIERLGATREQLKTRNEATAFVVPSGINALRGGLVVLLGFFTYHTIPYSEQEYLSDQAGLSIGHPWDFVGMLLAVIALGLTAVSANQKRDKPVATVATTTTTEPTSVALVPTPVATVVPSATPVVGQDFEAVAASCSPEDVTRYKDQFRHSQKRQHTSAGKATRTEHSDKFKEATGVLVALGYKIVLTGETYRHTHQIDGKAKVVTYKKRTWSNV